MTTAFDRTSVHLPRVLGVSFVGVLVAFLVQTALLPAVGLSATVPFVYATVALLAVVLGSGPGAIVGFAAGLLLDVTSVATLGVGALIGCLLGAAAGHVQLDRWWFSGVPTVGAMVVVSGGAFTTVNALLNQVPWIFGWGWSWTVVGGFVSVALLLPLRTWLRAVVR